MPNTEQVARFALRPSSGNCGRCEGGGEYVMNMETFEDAFTEAQLTEQEYACESVREACECEFANDDKACEAACYSAAGCTNCVNEGVQPEFEVQRYLQCQCRCSASCPVYFRCGVTSSDFVQHS